MFLETQPFYVNDFSGGITDFYLEAQPSRYKRADNLLIEQYGKNGELGKLLTRAGSELWDTVHPQIPTGALRIGNLEMFEGLVFSGPSDSLVSHTFRKLLIRSKHQIFYVDDDELNYDPGEWVTVKGRNDAQTVTITGPATPAVFTHVDHGLATGVEITLSTTGTLPDPFVVGTVYSVSVLSEDTFALEPSGGSPINSTTPGSGTHTYQFAEVNDVYRDTLTLETNNVAFARWNDFIFTTSDDDKTRPQKIYASGYEKKIITQNAGLPPFGTDGFDAPEILAFSNPGTTNTYLYCAFLQSTYYTQGTVTQSVKKFIDVGPRYPQSSTTGSLEVGMSTAIESGVSDTVTFTVASPTTVFWTAHPFSNGDSVVFRLTSTGPSDALPTGIVSNRLYFIANVAVNSFQISESPSLSPLVGVTDAGTGTFTGYERLPVQIQTFGIDWSVNGNNYHPETKVVLGRTVANGNVFYKIAEVSPVTVYYDGLSDAELIENELIYTEDGTVDFYEVTSARYIHIVNDIGYYGAIKETTTVGEEFFHRSRLLQSIPGAPGSVSYSFFTDFREEIKGVSSFRNYPLVFCDNSVYRIDGQFDEFGRGGMFPQQISTEASCVSHNSIVQTDVGVLWAGKNGFFFTDGYKVTRVSDGWPETYKDLVLTDTQKRNIQGKLDAFNRRVYWTMQSSLEEAAVATDCDRVYVLDLNYGISDDMPFTSLSGPSSSESFATALEFDGKVWYRGQHQGYLFTHDETVFTDPKINTLISPTDWLRDAIVYSYVSPGFNFGMSFTRYWVPRVIVQCRNITNLSLQILSNNDDSRIVTELKPILFRGNVTWGDPGIVWDVSDVDWNLSGFIEAQRRFTARALRCSFKQIELTNAFIAIIRSDDYGLVTLDSTANTVTLVNAPAVSWPEEAINYVLAFEGDGYVREFQVVTRTSDSVLTFSDPSNDAPINGTYKWVLRGIPLDEVFSLQSFTLHYAALGKTQQAYRAVTSGENTGA